MTEPTTEPVRTPPAAPADDEPVSDRYRSYTPSEPAEIRRKLLFGVTLLLALASVYAGLLGWGPVVQYGLAGLAVLTVLVALISGATGTAASARRAGRPDAWPDGMSRRRAPAIGRCSCSPPPTRASCARSATCCRACPFDVRSLEGMADIAAPEETGATFEANALLKARYYAEATGLLAVADDSGLEIDAMDGRPGVLSARYPGATYEERFANIWREMAASGRADRRARFVCADRAGDAGRGAVRDARHRRGRDPARGARHAGLRLRPDLLQPGAGQGPRRGVDGGEADGEPPRTRLHRAARLPADGRALTRRGPCRRRYPSSLAFIVFSVDTLRKPVVAVTRTFTVSASPSTVRSMRTCGSVSP